MTRKVISATTIIIATILVVPLVGIGSGNSIISINKSYAQLTARTISPGESSFSSSSPFLSSPRSTTIIPNSSPPSLPTLNSVPPSSKLSSATVSPLTSAATTTTTTTTSIIPPSSIPAISAKWARWVLQNPTPSNPIPDTTGANCAVNQNTNIPFWFLVGDFGGSVTRTCTIPKDRYIFFPVANALVTDFPSQPGNIQQEQALAKQLADGSVVSTLRASVDNRQISSSDIHRAQSAPFSYISPANNILDDPPGFATGVTDGYWVILNPLPVGQHTIHFSAQHNTGFSLDVTYRLVR